MDAVKVLVVDDELVSREKMKRIMRPIAECDEASSGPAAVEAVEEAIASGAPYDIITLDVIMPGMDGIEVLRRIREAERDRLASDIGRSKIIMVSSSSDKHTIVSCIKAGCNDYITKPFSTDKVIKKLTENGFAVDTGNPDMQAAAHAGAAPSPLDTVIARFNRGEVDLPPLPLIQRKFYELIRSGASLRAIGDLLRQDPAISSKLIRVSNSAFYRGFMDNVTVEQAINRLGLTATKQTVDTIAGRTLFDEANAHYAEVVERLWEHSLSCAHACHVISDLRGLRLSEDPFTMGLLHDIGKLMLLRVVGELEKSGARDVVGDAQALMAAVETHHGKAGGVLLKKWLFPAAYVQAAELHDDVGNVLNPGRELLVVHLANVIVKSMGYGCPNPPGVEPESLESLDILRLHPSMVQIVKDHVKTRMEELREYLG